MDSGIATIIVALIGAAASISGVFITNRGAKQHDKGFDKLAKEISRLSKQLAANDLKTARIDLRTALIHSRDDISAILELARIYFINLHGNADLGRKFLAWVKEYKVEAWAKKHKEDISDLIKAAKHSA